MTNRREHVVNPWTSTKLGFAQVGCGRNKFQSYFSQMLVVKNGDFSSHYKKSIESITSKNKSKKSTCPFAGPFFPNLFLSKSLLQGAPHEGQVKVKSKGSLVFGAINKNGGENLGFRNTFHTGGSLGGTTGRTSCNHLYHLESRWHNSHVLAYHGPLRIATFWEWLAIDPFTMVYRSEKSPE